MSVNPVYAFPRSARHLAVLTLFLEVVEEIDALRHDGADALAPSEALLADAMTFDTFAKILASRESARDEMSQLAPFVLAGS